MTFLAKYRDYIASHHFKDCPHQQKALHALQYTYEQAQKKIGWFHWFQKSTKRPPGVYLWGEVGVGKTWLMDFFYELLPEKNKLRWHFHRFMQQVHQELKNLAGQKNPLKIVAARLAKQAKVICLDEFLVTDIADAMLLANLLEALFANGTILVTTANVPPENLYRHGLQRARFLPAIQLLQTHLQVVHVAGQEDFRLQQQSLDSNYFFPLDELTQHAMERSFFYYSQGEDLGIKTIHFLDRPIRVQRCAQDVVWFDFAVICAPPRSQLDYLEIAKNYKTVLISNIPKIAPHQTGIASYFIKLIDVLYDAKINIVISAAVPLADIYNAGELIFDFKRTQSRLIEMQSEKYRSREIH